MEVWISGIGVRAPGLDDWPTTRAVLRGEATYENAPLKLEAPELLSARERRRTSPTVRLALGVAEESTRQSGVPSADLAAVFGSSNGDGTTLHQLLETLTTPDGMVSPTQFHNSVHNAAIGYWSIGTGSQLPATSLAAHDFTFGATLLKAALQSVSDGTPVLLTVFDIPFPEPLQSSRPMSVPFAVSLVLQPQKAHNSLAHLALDWPARQDTAPTEPKIEALHPLWAGNPAARALPVLDALATGAPADVTIRYPQDGSIRLNIAGC